MNNIIPFYKYHGAGNDFVMIDNRLPGSFDVKNPDLIARLCHRNFGIGGDGLILLENDNESDFKMRYFNADGREGSMCGNGGRCIVAFANDLGIIDSEGSFSATDGIHFFKVLDNDHFAISLIDVTKIECKQNGYFIDTGVDNQHPGPKHNYQYSVRLFEHIKNNFRNYLPDNLNEVTRPLI
jgi:diaminopimelate epimerase